MTCLLATVLGRWYFLYLILDLYSRKTVSWEVHGTDDSHHASHLIARAALSEFKVEAVKEVLERGHHVREVAERLGVTTHSLYDWVKRYGVPPEQGAAQGDQAAAQAAQS
jgi:DNA-binding NtrC family response regulator